jgi:hypothetical protein
MVATDEELWIIWANRPRGPLSAGNALRAIYNLGRQHSAQPCQEEEAAPSPTHDLTSAAPLLWVLWHHLGASSPVGQPIRRYLGMGQHDRMTPEEVVAAKRWARRSMGVQDYLDSIPSYSSAAPEPAPPPTPDGGLLEKVAWLLANRISTMRPGADCTPLARDVLRVLADAAEKMARDPNLTWERVAIWLDVESEQ